MKGKTIGGILATVLVLGGISSIGNNNSTDFAAVTPTPSISVASHAPTIKPSPTAMPTPKTTPTLTSSPTAVPTVAPTPMPTPGQTTVPTPIITPTPEPAPIAVSTENEIEYIGNKNSKKFHRQSCRSLPKEKNRIYITGRDNAVAKGYSPCGNCDP